MLSAKYHNKSSWVCSHPFDSILLFLLMIHLILMIHTYSYIFFILYNNVRIIIFNIKIKQYNLILIFN